MNTSTWLLPLRVLSVALGLAIVVLFVVWMQADATAVPKADPKTSAADAKSAEEIQVKNEPSKAQESGDPEKSISRDTTDVDAPSIAALFGTLRHADDELVERGVLWLYRQGKHVVTARVTKGVYSFAGLEPGSYTLRSRVQDALPLKRELEVHGPSTRQDIVLAARWLLAVHVVTSDGKPLLQEVNKLNHAGRRGITAAAFATPLAKDLPLSNLAEVDAGLGPFRGTRPFQSRGEKSLPKKTLGILTLPAGKDVHVALMMRGHVVTQLPVAAGEEEVTFTMSVSDFLGHMGKARIRIVDRDGKPLAGAQVALNDAQTGGGGVKTDADGRATLSHLKPGRLDLEVRFRGLRPPPVQVDVHAGADLYLGNIVMLPGVLAEVVMDNFGGDGSVRIHWLGLPAVGMTFDDMYLSVESSPTRKMQFYPGRYAFLAASPSGVAIKEVDLHTAPATPIRFDLQPGAPLRIVNEVGSGVSHLELLSPSGIPVRRRQLTGNWTQTVQLPPGLYTARIRDMTGALTERKIDLKRTGATLTVR